MVDSLNACSWWFIVVGIRLSLLKNVLAIKIALFIGGRLFITVNVLTQYLF